MPNPIPIQLQDRLSDEELENLKPYLKKSERGQPIAFEGRMDVRNFVEEKIIQVRSGYAPEDCNTVIIEGAPGAGKSSLLRQIKEDTEENAVNQDVIPLLFEVESLNNPVMFLQRLLSHQRTDFEALSTSYAKAGSRRVNLKLFEFSGGISHYFPSLADRIRNSPEEIWNAVRESLQGNIDPIFLLLIDESQRIEPNKNDKNTLATNMHGVTDIAGLKIIPVFAGLSDTGYRLKKVGITRPAEKAFNLGLLEQDEGIHVCRSTIQTLNISKLFKSNDLDTVCAHLDNASDGWPRHIHHYVRHFVHEVLKSHEEGRDWVDLNYVLDLGHDNRIEYYQDRLNETDWELADKVLNDVAKKSATKEPLTFGTLHKSFGDVIGHANVKSVLQQYVHDGIFDKNRDGTYSFPIPSLRTFLANDRDVLATKNALQNRLRTQNPLDTN